MQSSKNRLEILLYCMHFLKKHVLNGPCPSFWSSMHFSTFNFIFTYSIDEIAQLDASCLIIHLKKY